MPRRKMKVIEVPGTAQSEPVRWTWKAREVSAVLLLVLAAYAGISLGTYEPTDVPSVFWDPHRHGFASNQGGTLGAALAGFLFRYLGFVSYGLAFLGAFWGTMILLRREIRDGLTKFAGVVLFLGASSTLLSLLTPEGFSRSELYRGTTLPSLGGAYGDLCRDLLVCYIGPLGTFLAVLLVLSVSMVLATDWMIYLGLQRGWRGSRVLLLGAGQIARRLQTAWAAMPPLLQIAGHDLRVRVPAARADAAEEGDDARSDRGSARRRRKAESTEERSRAASREDASGPTDPEPFAPASPGEGEATAIATEPQDDEAESPPRPATGRSEGDAELSGTEAAPPSTFEPPPAADYDGGEESAAVEPWTLTPAPGEPCDERADAEPEPSAPVGAADSASALPHGPDAAGENPALEADVNEGQVRPLPPGPPLTINLGTPAPTSATAPERPALRSGPTPYRLPDIALLEDPVHTPVPALERDIEHRIKTIEAALASFGIQARVVHVDRGPSLTMYELELAPGIRVNKIIGMSDDLAIALKAPNVRIVAPIPGKSSIGIEVPNTLKEAVRLKELITAADQPWKSYTLPLFLGKDVSGVNVVKNLEEMPHLLVAGTTGSGKSVCLNTIILSLLMTRKPDELKLILVDPKMVELSMFKDLPHLLSPVVTDMKRAPVVLDWVVRCMEDRYELMARAGVKKISTFNSLGERKVRERLGVEPDVEVPNYLPRIVVVIDELADLMMVASKEVEFAITRLAQKSRAVGIHLVLATQRPSVDVITGLIKSNMPARIAFKVASGIDSRTILDQNGAERLLGKGDMLISVPGSMDLVRTQCSYVADQEIQDVVQFCKDQGMPAFDSELVEVAEGEHLTSGEQDDLYAEAVKVVVESGRGSTSLLQRKLGIGYTRAARLVDFMAKDGIVGAFKGSKAREVLWTPDIYHARFVAAER